MITNFILVNRLQRDAIQRVLDQGLNTSKHQKFRIRYLVKTEKPEIKPSLRQARQMMSCKENV
jgi:hypothetical protein